jgi:hypothetical protein
VVRTLVFFLKALALEGNLKVFRCFSQEISHFFLKALALKGNLKEKILWKSIVTKELNEFVLQQLAAEATGKRLADQKADSRRGVSAGEFQMWKPRNDGQSWEVVIGIQAAA